MVFREIEDNCDQFPWVILSLRLSLHFLTKVTISNDEFSSEAPELAMTLSSHEEMSGSETSFRKFRSLDPMNLITLQAESEILEAQSSGITRLR